MSTSNPFGLYQKNSAGSWMLPIQLPDGNRTTRSTKTDSLKEAIKKAPGLIAEVLSSHKEGTEVIKTGWTIAKCFDEYIANQKRLAAAKNSLRNYEISRKHVTSFLPAGKAIQSLKGDDFLKLYDHLTGKGLAHSSIQNAITIFRAALNHAKKAGEWKGSTSDLIPASCLRKPVPNAKYLTPEDFKRLLLASKKHLRDYWLGYVYTGARRRELFEITERHLDFKRKTIELPGTKTKSSHRTIPMHPDLEKLLKERLAVTEKGKPLFPLHQNIQLPLARACKKAGVTEITVHGLRHTFAAWMLSTDTPIQTVSRLMGHSSIETTQQTYGHIMKAAQQEVILRLPSMMEPEAIAAPTMPQEIARMEEGSAASLLN